METKQRKAAALGCVIASALLFSTGGLLIKLCTWSAISINGARSLFAAVVMYSMLRYSGYRFQWTKTVVIGACITAMMNYSFVIATKLTSAGNAIVLQFTQPIFIILLLWAVLKQRPSHAAVITCLVVFSGIVCFFFDQLTLTGMIGNLFAIFSGLTYAIVFLFKSMDGADFESSVVLSFLLSFLVSIPSIAGESSFTAQNITCVVLLGVFQMGIAFVLLGKGLSEISPVTASLTSTIEPILNPLLVAAFYGETLGALSIVGAIVVISASAIYNVLESRKAQAKPTAVPSPAQA